MSIYFRPCITKLGAGGIIVVIPGVITRACRWYCSNKTAVDSLVQAIPILFAWPAVIAGEAFAFFLGITRSEEGWSVIEVPAGAILVGRRLRQCR